MSAAGQYLRRSFHSPVSTPFCPLVLKAFSHQQMVFAFQFFSIHAYHSFTVQRYNFSITFLFISVYFATFANRSVNIIEPNQSTADENSIPKRVFWHSCLFASGVGVYDTHHVVGIIGDV